MMNEKGNKGKVFYNGKNYISPDRDGHKGGVWKKGETASDLNSKKTRAGTYDENLKYIAK